MSRRVPRMPPASLSGDQRSLYDAIASGPRASGPFALVGEDGALEGPFNAMLLQPALGAALQGLGGAVRYRTGLGARAREIAILTVARVWESDFERQAHESVGRAVGMSDAELAALADGDPGAFPDPYEKMVFSIATALAARSDLADHEYAEAVEMLGLPIVFELTTLVGYYATLALQMRVFRV
jgi:4-carboxymuconolactone decarboxylase